METKQDKPTLNKINEPIVIKILQTIQSLKYGSIEIVIHNSKIVQINKTEKMRFDEEKFMRCK